MEWALSNWVNCAIAAIYGYLVFLGGLWRILKVGRSFFTVERRTTPPAALNDPALGHHRHAHLSGCKLHYVAAGDPSHPMILFVHGFPDFWYSWRYQIKAFSTEGFYTVALDTRGYGNSQRFQDVSRYRLDLLVNDLIQLIEKLRQPGEKINLVGHDWGGVICSRLAAARPDLFARYVHINAPLFTDLSDEIKSNPLQFLKSWYIWLFQIPLLPELWLVSQDLRIFDQLFTFLTRRPGLASHQDVECYKYTFSQPGAMCAALNYYRANFQGIDWFASLRSLLASLIKPKPKHTPRRVSSMHSQDGRRRSQHAQAAAAANGGTHLQSSHPNQQRIVVPTLVIWGDNDQALTINLATRAARHIDHYTLRVVEGGNHFVQMDRPDEVNELIRDFIAPPPQAESLGGSQSGGDQKSVSPNIDNMTASMVMSGSAMSDLQSI